VTIAGYPGETVTLRPPDNVHALRLSVGAPAYLIFQDFIIDAVNSTSGGAEPEGIYLSNGAHHNRFQRLEVRNVKSFGIAFSRNNGNSPFNQVLDCKVHRTGNGRGDPRNGHGFYISTSDNLVEGNEVYDNEGYGINLYDDSGTKEVTRNVVKNNNVYRNGRHGGTAYGIVVAWGDKNVVSGNAVTGNPGGVMVYSGSTNAEVSGNRIYANTPLEGVFIQYSTGTVIKDNEIFGNGVSIVDLGVGTRLTGNR
jgi:parallel beta-helix repeat protein